MDEKEMRSRAQKLRKNMTKEENLLWYKFLRHYPLQFRRQYQIGNYIADFYCYRAQLVVELDGSQHCEGSELVYDQKRTEYMQQQGLLVLRISNLDVLRQFAAVCQHIDRIARQRAEIDNG